MSVLWNLHYVLVLVLMLICIFLGGRGGSHCVAFLGRTVNSHSASPQNTEILRQNIGGNLPWTSIPFRGSNNTPSRLHATETGISSGSVGQFGPGGCSFTLHV